MTLAERVRARRIRMLEDRIADLDHDIDKWGFGMTPSEIRFKGERLEMLRARLAALTDQTDRSQG